MQQRFNVQRLSHRLERLEKQVTEGSPLSQPSPSQFSTPLPAEPMTDTSRTGQSPAISLVAENGQDCKLTTRLPCSSLLLGQMLIVAAWVYRMATDASRNFRNEANSSTMHTQQVDNAMSSLSEAIEELGKLRIRKEMGISGTNFDLPQAEYDDCIDSFFFLVSNILIPDFRWGPLNRDFLRALPAMVSTLTLPDEASHINPEHCFNRLIRHI